jgi:hypothetical protein
MSKRRRQRLIKPRTQDPPKEESNSAVSEEQERQAQEEFVRGVLTRGEAAHTKDGELPPGATHEIVEEPDGELPKIRRRRVSLF